MKRRWGKISPERRYKLSSINQLFTKIQQEGGIRNMTKYKKFIGGYESIINYFKRYQYIQGDIIHNQEILASLSSSVQESIYKEMIKDKSMVQALNGGYIIPRLEILKLYIEQDLEAKVLVQQKGFSQEKSQEKKAKFEEESWEEVLKQMKDLTQKIQNSQPQAHKSKDTGKESVKELLKQLKHLSEVVESTIKTQERNNQDQKVTQNSQPFRPRYPLPPISSSYQPYVPDQIAPRQLLKCYYFLEEGHSTRRCNNLTEDLEKRTVLKCGGTYLFPNFQRVPTEGPTSEKELVKQFAKEQEELKKRMVEKSNSPPNKQEKTVIEESKGGKAAAISQIEEQGNWKPPQISPTNENIQINVGLRQTRQRASRQESQSQTQKEDKNETHKPFKKDTRRLPQGR
ncbi:hypothetical protein O181_068160 [Austropuccinia psidii MF-1]|uniref:Uncharacterized protein n=1 Tax=Austropuccinia psidii MF-1 TaxID=1389203 RepID=A0A9Q3I6T5_9BASI|nr:hypothetical protein [Austropuccinia psidii MF-1]